MDGKGRNVIVCDNGTGVRIFVLSFSTGKSVVADSFCRPFWSCMQVHEAGLYDDEAEG